MVEVILNRLQDILMSFTLCKAASVKDRGHLTCCERLKWMARNHVTKRVQDFVSKAWHYQHRRG